jgi:hypothetical protein
MPQIKHTIIRGAGEFWAGAKFVTAARICRRILPPGFGLTCKLTCKLFLHPPSQCPAIYLQVCSRQSGRVVQYHYSGRWVPSSIPGVVTLIEPGPQCALATHSLAATAVQSVIVQCTVRVIGPASPGWTDRPWGKMHTVGSSDKTRSQLSLDLYF